MHNVLSGTQYRCEYRRADRSTMFQRNIRFHVEICTVKSMDTSVPDSYYVTFTLITGRTSSTSDLYPSTSLSGQARRFKKLCEEIQTLFLASKDRLAKQRRQTNDTRPVSTTPSVTSNRSNASFISALFGNTGTPSCKKNHSFRLSSRSNSLENRADSLVFCATSVTIRRRD